MRLTRFMMAAAVALGTAAVPGLAQDQDDTRPDRDRAARGDRERAPRGAGAARLTPEQAMAAWEVQGRGVAVRLGLDEAAGSKLVKVYVGSRKAFGEAVQAAREEAREARESSDESASEEGGRRRGQGRDGGRFGRINAELREEHAGELAKAIGAFLDEAQTKKAVASLGTFSQAWDLMVDAIGRFELEDTGKPEALAHIETFIVATNPAGRSDDRQGRREAMRDARRALTEGLDSILSEEQMGEFTRLMRGGRGGGGAFGGGFAGMLERFDGNGDGKLQEDELPERMQQFFDRLDANGDGAIDEEEAAAMRGGRRRGGGGLDDN